MELLSLERVIPKYLKLFASMSHTLFMSVSALLLLVIMILLLLVLVFISYVFGLSDSLLVRSCSLQFFVGCCYQIDVICKAKFTDNPSNDGNGSVMVFQGFSHDVYSSARHCFIPIHSSFETLPTLDNFLHLVQLFQPLLTGLVGSDLILLVWFF